MTEPSNLWIYNYDFEFELAGKAPGKKPFPWYFLNRTAPSLLPLMGEQDTLLVYEKPPEPLLENLREKLRFSPNFQLLNAEQESNSIFDDLRQNSKPEAILRNKRLMPWGWSGKAIELNQFAASSPLIDTEPSESLIRELNSKVFSCRVREELLPEKYRIPSHIIDHYPHHGTEPLREILSDFHQENPDFFVKHALGVSGKNLDFVNSSDFSRKKLNIWRHWANREGGIVMEAKIPVFQEWSLQYHFPKQGEPELLALTQLLSGSDQSYQGSIIQNSKEKEGTILSEELKELLRIIKEKNYYGPLGIDFIETEKGKFKLLEVNARYTMGRVAYEWHKRIDRGEIGYFTNIFLRPKEKITAEFLLKRSMEVEKKFPGATVVPVNLVTHEKSQITLITIFIAGKSDFVSVNPKKMLAKASSFFQRRIEE